MRMIRWGLEGACSGQNKEHPQDAHILILQKSWISYLTWHKGLCRFKLQILKWGDYGDGPSLITCVHTKSFQSCWILCDPMDYSLPGSSVIGILQARILEWVAIPSSRGSSWPREWTRVSCIADRFFTIRVMRQEPPLHDIICRKH